MRSYDDLVDSFRGNPRNVCTTPKNGQPPRWFWVSVTGSQIYVESGKTKEMNSRIQGRRALNRGKFDDMLELYHRRERGESVSSEATAKTHNQVYWFGILKEMNA